MSVVVVHLFYFVMVTSVWHRRVVLLFLKTIRWSHQPPTVKVPRSLPRQQNNHQHHNSCDRRRLIWWLGGEGVIDSLHWVQGVTSHQSAANKDGCSLYAINQSQPLPDLTRLPAYPKMEEEPRLFMQPPGALRSTAGLGTSTLASIFSLGDNTTWLELKKPFRLKVKPQTSLSWLHWLLTLIHCMTENLHTHLHMYLTTKPPNIKIIINKSKIASDMFLHNVISKMDKVEKKLYESQN